MTFEPAQTIRSSYLTLSNVIFFAVSTAFPALLVAALAVPLGRDLKFGPDFLGLAVALFFATTSLLGHSMGRLARILGSRKGMALAGAMSSIALVALATSRSKAQLVVALMLGGAANALAHPTVNAALSRIVDQTRQGLVFGVKQAAAPMAGLLGGIAVPVIALTLGWRWVFVTAAALAVGNALLQWWRPDAHAAEPPDAPAAAAPRPDLRSRPPLIAYAVAAGLGSAGANSITIFLVAGAVNDVDFTQARAAAVFTAANIAGIVVRIGSGILVDRWPTRAVAMICAMLGLGVGGCLLLAVSSQPAYVVGAVVAGGIGWGWTGVLHYLVVTEYADRPETATGTLLTGFAFGSASGPIVLGQIAAHLEYSAVWFAAGTLCLTSALVLIVASYAANGRALLSQ